VQIYLNQTRLFYESFAEIDESFAFFRTIKNPDNISGFFIGVMQMD
jgi:hypothetical protein